MHDEERAEPTITIRLTLISPAPSTSLREARVDDDGPLDERGRRQARTAASALGPANCRVLSAPSLRCRQSAEALCTGGAAAKVELEPALRDCDMGTWRGRTLPDLAAAEPESVAAWTTDPAAAPHGGESIGDLCARVANWLDRLPDDTGRLLAVTEPAVIRAAVLHALSAPTHAFWRIDVPPLATAILVGRNGRWNLRLGGPLD